jgi:YidC/Oxa1 family membrane protein insertase
MSSPRSARAADSIIVRASRVEQVYLDPGAVPARVQVTGFLSLRPGRRNTPLIVTQPGAPLLHYRLALGADTIALDTVHFNTSANGSTATFTATSPAMTFTYSAVGDGLRTQVRGSVQNPPPGSALLIDLPSTLYSNEADTLDDQRHFAYGYKMPLRDPTSIAFTKLDVNSVRADTGSFEWVNVRNKYWLIALMQPVGSAKPAGVFRGMTMRGGVRAGRNATTAYATTSYPLSNGQFAFDMYIGPQSFEELRALNNDLVNVNPYAGWLHAIVQPFATIVMRVLLWMKATFHVNYGWVLVIFGVVIRLILWPLNQKAMRTSIQMQWLQPELTEIQKRYKNEPEKQRDALVKLYSSHGMSPLSPMLGCLPMLLPMPVLFALYFVFQNTIEFRGVSFLWLPDISLRDPYYIIPLVMGASMFLLSWIGMKAAPPNPQAKVMSYMMPAMFTMMFLNFASGLNLYYAVQNIAALPQQLVLTRERAKAGIKPPTPSRAKK